MDAAREALRAGVTGDDIDKVVYKACIERNAYPSPLNYYLFPKSVCVYVASVATARGRVANVACCLQLCERSHLPWHSRRPRDRGWGHHQP